MNLFESINESTTQAVKSGEHYLKHSEAYFKLKIFQQLSLTFSTLLKLAIVGGLLFLGLLFLAIAGAIALGKWLDNLPLGIIIVGLILLLFALLVYLLRKKIDKITIRRLSKSYFD